MWKLLAVIMIALPCYVFAGDKEEADYTQGSSYQKLFKMVQTRTPVHEKSAEEKQILKEHKFDQMYLNQKCAKKSSGNSQFE